MLWWIDAAFAGACCGATGAIPARLDSCDQVLFGLDLTGEVALARWNADAEVVDVSSEEQALTTSALVAARWAETGQGLLMVPVRWDHRSAGDLDETGLGVGDIRAQLRWTIPGRLDGWSLPTLIAGARIPTGVSWDASVSPLMADVTGEPGTGVQLGVSWEGARHLTPFSVELSGEIPTGEAVGRFSASGGVGRYFEGSWTLFASLSWTHGFGEAPSDRSAIGLRLLHGEQKKWKMWLGVGTDLPIPGIGRDNPVMANLTGGLAWVR